MNRAYGFVLPLAAAVLAPSLGFAVQVTAFGTFKAWSTYETGAGDGRVCYALAKPTSTDPAKIKRDPARRGGSGVQLVLGWEIRVGA